MKTRLFELNDKVKKFTEPKSLTRIRVVVQDSRKVINSVSGLEPMIFMYLWNNMKQNQFALVFNEETEKMLGYISKDNNGIPQRYIETEELYFKDMYERI